MGKKKWCLVVKNNMRYEGNQVQFGSELVRQCHDTVGRTTNENNNKNSQPQTHADAHEQFV
jgi:hypothetical protein